MKIKKKASLGGEFAKVGEDLVDGKTVVIRDAGREIEGDYGTQLVFKVDTANGEKLMRFNQTTLNNLVDAFGDDSEDWVDNIAKVHVVKVMVSGKMRNVAYLSGLDYDMVDDGSFQKRKSNPSKMTVTNSEGVEINYEV